MIRYIDIHSHIHDREFDDDREKVLFRMKEKGVATIAVGTHYESSKDAAALSEKERHVFVSIGLHPTDTKEDFNEKLYLDMAKNSRVVAIGECGLDYFRGNIDEKEKERQKKIFSLQINLALSVDKPLMIHGRHSKGGMDAYLDIIEILNQYKKEHSGRLKGNIHFFSGNIEIAKKFLELGFTMSFTGVVTFTRDYDEIIRFLPITSIMAETDAPYASPVPYRGKRNEPIYVIETTAKIAEIRGEKEETVAEALFKNAINIFGLRDF